MDDLSKALLEVSHFLTTSDLSILFLYAVAHHSLLPLISDGAHYLVWTEDSN
jgi:hypothetical protein